MELTKGNIVKLLETKDKHVIGRALVALNDRQTAVEQRIKDTINRNGRGFRPSHAYMGTSMAQFYTGAKHLTPKQIDYWTKPTQRVKNSNTQKVSRISIYAGQLLKVAQIKKGLKDCPHVYSLSDDNVVDQRLGQITAWCKESGLDFFVNPEDPFAGIYFANEGDVTLCQLMWA